MKMALASVPQLRIRGERPVFGGTARACFGPLQPARWLASPTPKGPHMALSSRRRTATLAALVGMSAFAVSGLALTPGAGAAPTPAAKASPSALAAQGAAALVASRPASLHVSSSDAFI